jgi:hypothetical protein
MTFTRFASQIAPALIFFCFANIYISQNLFTLEHNNPGLTVDLAVGVWGITLPMD